MAYEIGMVLAVLALLAWGSYPVFMKKVVGRLGEYTCLLFNHGLLVLMLLLTAIFTIKFKMPSDFVTAAVILGGIVGAAAIYLYYKAINMGSVSVATVLAVTLQIIWTVIVSFFLFSEKLSLVKYIAIAVIIVGAILAALERLSLPEKFDQKHVMKFLKSDIWSKGTLLALVVSFCWAFYNIASKYSVDSIGPHKTIVYMETLVLLFILFAFLVKSSKELVVVPKKDELKWILISAVLFGVGALGFYFSMAQINLSIIAPVVAATPAVTALLAAVLLKEKLRIHQYIGIVLAVAGVVVLSL